MSDEVNEQAQTGEESPDDGDLNGEYMQVGKYERTVDYLETEKGHQVALRMVVMMEQIVPVIKSLLEAKVEAQRVLPMLQLRKWRMLLFVRLVVFIVAVGSLIYMRQVGTIDPAIALLVGGLVAYFFGYNRSQS
nr:hypothetical protein [uncultured bacterium]